MARDLLLDVHGDLRPLEREIRNLSRKPVNLNLDPLKKGAQPLGRISGEIGEFEKAIEASNARVLAFGASAGAIYAVSQAMRSMVEATIEVEKSLADINVILNVSSDNLEKFGNQLFRIANSTGQSFYDVAEAATELSRQGLTVEQTLTRTRDALILTRLSGMGATESVEALTAALNSFSRVAITSTELINKMAAVDAAFAVSSADLAEAVKRVGSSAQEAGLDIDQLMAIVTSAQQITARGGAVIGNSFKTIFTRIQRPRVITALEELGVQVRAIDGNIRPAMQILNELAKTYDHLTQSQQAQIAELLGGVFQVNVLKAAIRDLGKEFSLYESALDISNKATDEATRRNAQLNKTVAATLNETVQNLTKTGAAIGKLTFEPAAKRVLGGINSILENVDLEKPKSVGEKLAAGVLGGIGKFLSGPGLIFAGMTLIKMFMRLSQHVTEAFRTISGLGQISQHQMKIQEKIFALLSKNPQVLNRIQRGEMGIRDGHNQILSLIKMETKELKSQTRIVEQLAASLASAGVKQRELGHSRVRALEGGRYLSSGFVPNFSQKDKAMAQAELSSASYAKPSTRAVKDRMPGLGNYVRNTAETKTFVPGMKQHFVNPPKNSPEGRAHLKKSIQKTGINPYRNQTKARSQGFIPNFVENSENRLRNAKTEQGMSDMTDIVVSVAAGMPPPQGKSSKSQQVKADPVGFLMKMMDQRDVKIPFLISSERIRSRPAAQHVQEEGNKVGLRFSSSSDSFGYEDIIHYNNLGLLSDGETHGLLKEFYAKSSIGKTGEGKRKIQI